MASETTEREPMSNEERLKLLAWLDEPLPSYNERSRLQAIIGEGLNRVLGPSDFDPWDDEEWVVKELVGLLRTALLAQPQEPKKPKHEFRIVGNEDALLETCEDEPVELESVGIYEDMPTPCPRCGDKLVLKMGHSILYTLPEPAGGEDE